MGFAADRNAALRESTLPEKKTSEFSAQLAQDKEFVKLHGTSPSAYPEGTDLEDHGLQILQQ